MLKPPFPSQVVPFHTKLPATATQFLLEKRPELRATKIGQHILEKHPEKHAVLGIIDPAAIEELYNEATWKPRPSTHMFLFVWAFVYGPLPGDIQDILFEYLFCLSQPVSNWATTLLADLGGGTNHSAIVLVSSAIIIGLAGLAVFLGSRIWDACSRKYRWLDVSNIIDDLTT